MKNHQKKAKIVVISERENVFIPFAFQGQCQRKHFKQKTISRPDVLLGIGDDGAVIKPPKNQLLVFSME